MTKQEYYISIRAAQGRGDNRTAGRLANELQAIIQAEKKATRA